MTYSLRMKRNAIDTSTSAQQGGTVPYTVYQIKETPDGFTNWPLLYTVQFHTPYRALPKPFGTKLLLPYIFYTPLHRFQDCGTRSTLKSGSFDTVTNTLIVTFDGVFLVQIFTSLATRAGK